MRTKFLCAIFLFIAVFLFSPFVKTAEAAFLNFDQSTVSVNTGATFQIAVIVDAGSDSISAAEGYILYDQTLLEAQSVAPDTFFPSVTNNITPGKVYIFSGVLDAATYRTGSGKAATITFKALKDGTGSLTFDCQGLTGPSKIVKNDINATNVIVCSQNGSSEVTVGNGGGGTGGGGGSNGTPSTLPSTGIIENLTNIAIPGAILLLIGGLLRIVI